MYPLGILPFAPSVSLRPSSPNNPSLHLVVRHSSALQFTSGLTFISVLAQVPSFFLSSSSRFVHRPSLAFVPRFDSSISPLILAPQTSTSSIASRPQIQQPKSLVCYRPIPCPASPALHPTRHASRLLSVTFLTAQAVPHSNPSSSTLALG